jgi:hypothetical protein
LDLTNTDPRPLLTGCQTPAAIRRTGAERLQTSMPGLGIILGAEFVAATGGDVAIFGTADRLAGFGGVAPVPAIPEQSAATSGHRSDTTTASNTSSTSRRCSASGTARRHTAGESTPLRDALYGALAYVESFAAER